jgi:hypothetical protein
MMRAFIKETTARLRCVRVFVKIRSVTYVSISCLPHMAIMCHHERGSKDIFRPHTEAFACWRCTFFIPWTAGVNNCFARTWKRTSWRARRYAGCPWGRHGCSWDAIWVNKCAQKKRALVNYPCGSNDFFVLKACTPVHIRVRKSKNCEFENKRRFSSDQFGRIWTLFDLKMRSRPLKMQFHVEVRFSTERSSYE